MLPRLMNMVLSWIASGRLEINCDPCTLFVLLSLPFWLKAKFNFIWFGFNPTCHLQSWNQKDFGRCLFYCWGMDRARNLRIWLKVEFLSISFFVAWKGLSKLMGGYSQRNTRENCCLEMVLFELFEWSCQNIHFGSKQPWNWPLHG